MMRTPVVSVPRFAMQVLLNGQKTEISENSTIVSLLEQTQMLGKRVAVELNGDIVARSQHALTVLKADDRIEIVHAIGGG